eukprot:12810424-Alexandrium_andersonii.AAC.1
MIGHARTHTHTREVGQGGYPYDHPAIWDCEACVNRWPRDEAGRLLEPGKCRYSGVAGCNSGPRKGHRPRSPMPPA